jgi:hypothetical protein
MIRTFILMDSGEITINLLHCREPVVAIAADKTVQKD